MKIVVTRGGGFGGLSQQIASAETDALAPTKACEVLQMVAAMNFFEMPERVAGEAVGADFFHYTITLSKNGREHRVEFLDDSSEQTSSLRKLVDLLTAG